MNLFKARTADQVEDKLLKLVEQFEKSIQKEEAKEGSLVGLDGLLFVKKAKEQMESLGVNVSKTQMHILKESIAHKQTDRINEIISGVGQLSGLPNSEDAGRFKQIKLGVKGKFDIGAESSVLSALGNAQAIAIPLVVGYAVYKGIAALVNKASDMAYKASINKEALSIPVVDSNQRKNRNTI
jgi:hypothetical protein